MATSKPMEVASLIQDVPANIAREEPQMQQNVPVEVEIAPVPQQVVENAPAPEVPDILPENGGSALRNPAVVPDNELQEEDNDIEIQESSNEQERTTVCPCTGSCSRFFWVSKILDKKYSIPFWLLLFSLPISAIYMGRTYSDSCPYRSSYPYIFVIMGFTGIVAIVNRILLILYSPTWEQRIKKLSLQLLMWFNVLLTFVLFFGEFLITWHQEPDFHPESKSYCDYAFWNYVFWANCVTFGLFVLIFILKCPNCAPMYEGLQLPPRY